MVGGGVDQLCGNANALDALADAPFDEVSDPKIAADQGFQLLDSRFQAIADALQDHANTERAKLGLGPADAKYLPWMTPAE